MALSLNQKVAKSGSSTVGTGSRAPQSQWVEFFRLIKSLAVFFAIAFLLRASVVEAFKIPSSSMYPTLQKGDHILVNKLSYGIRIPFRKTTIFGFREPHRGDVVVFTRPDNPATKEDESETNIIKRIIGLPGDVVQVAGTKVLINNELLSEDARYARWLFGGRKDFGPARVPEGHVLLLGDNRDESKDSRFWEDPFLNIDRIKGHAFFIYWNSRLEFRRFFTVIS